MSWLGMAMYTQSSREEDVVNGAMRCAVLFNVTSMQMTGRKLMAMCALTGCLAGGQASGLVIWDNQPAAEWDVAYPVGLHHTLTGDWGREPGHRFTVVPRDTRKITENGIQV